MLTILPDAVRIVEYVLIFLIILIIIFDVILYKNDTKGDTISNIIRDWINGKYFFITFAWGVLAGHLFLGAKSDIINNEPIRLGILIGIIIILAIVGIIINKRLKLFVQIILLVTGILAGHFLWSLNC